MLEFINNIGNDFQKMQVDTNQKDETSLESLIKAKAMAHPYFMQFNQFVFISRLTPSFKEFCQP